MKIKRRKSAKMCAVLSVLAVTALASCGTTCESSHFGTLEIDLVTGFNADGSVEQFLTSNGKGVVTPGTTGVLNVTGVEDGQTLSVTSDGGSISTSGGYYTFTAPSVSSKTDVTITATVEDGENTYKKSTVVTVVPESMFGGNGFNSFTSADYDQRDAITAQLEKYLIENNLSPLTFLNTGTYQLYNSRVHSPFLDENNYIPGYGFGVSTYGWVDAPLSGEATEEFKNYYHGQLSASLDEGSFNELATNSANPSYFSDYISMYYFSSWVNKDGNGYEYGTGLSRKSAPEAIDPDENGASNKWKIYLYVGEGTGGEENGVLEGFNYRVNSSVASIAAFDNTPIKLEDYLTTFKVLATQSVGWYRGSEQAAESNEKQQIKGFADYYNNSKDFTELESDEAFMKKVGVSIDHSDNSITIEFNDKFSPDFAEYYLDGVWCNPMSEEHLKVLGGGNAVKGTAVWAVNGTVDGKSVTPQDTRLSVGPWYTYYYESKKTAAFKKNDTWPIKEDPYGREIYRLEGIHLNINSAMNDDENNVIVMWENNQTDSSDIPTDYWDKYVSDPRRIQIPGSSLFPIYWVNTFNNQSHSYLFPGSDWEVKEILSNNNFFKGLIVGMDRNTMADYYHYNPTYAIQEPVNKSTPKSSTAHNDSTYWKETVEDTFGDSLDDYSEWKANAAEYFEKAIEEELEAGHYTLGTASCPTTITLELVSTDDTTRKYCDSVVFSNWEEAFDLAVSTHYDDEGNTPWMDGDSPLIKLDVTTEIVSISDPSLQSKILSYGVQAGNYDGQTVYRVTGNGLDTVGNMKKYMSNNQSGFTLNYGPITSVVSPDIYYDGKYWSYDGLYNAANNGGFFDDLGQVASAYEDMEPVSGSLNSSGDLEMVYKFTGLNYYVTDMQPQGLLNQANGGDGSTYVDITNYTFDKSAGTVTFTYPASCLWSGEDYTGSDDYASYWVYDVQFKYTMSDGTHSVTGTTSYDAGVIAKQ